MDGAGFCFVVETRDVAGAGETAGEGEGLFELNQDFLTGVGETAAGDVAAVVGFVVEARDVAAGETAGEGEGLFELNQDFLTGVGETAAGDVAAVVGFVLETRELAGAGETEGEVEGLLDLRVDCFAGVGETAAGETEGAGAVSFFAERLCFAGLGDAAGLAAGDGDGAASEVTENPTNVIIRPINLFIARP